MTYEVEPKRDEIKWDLGDWELIRRHPEVYRVMLPLLNRKMVIPEGIEVTTYTSTDNINPEPLFMFGAPGTGRGMIARSPDPYPDCNFRRRLPL